MPDFIPGLELSRLFYQEVVAPLLSQKYPNLKFSAALIGSGSEVLGFDTPMSSDHDWGPRALLFLSEEDYAAYQGEIDTLFRKELPAEFRGYPTDFHYPPSPPSSEIDHRITIWTLRRYFLDALGTDIQNEIQPTDWLTFAEQILRTAVEGAVFRDDIGLQAIRDKFAYFPNDIWLYLLAAGWTRIGQEEHLMGRAGYVGDEIGSALIAARLVRDLMRLCFLMEKQYAPYPKWFGTAFSRLSCAEALSAVLKQILTAETWQEREVHLVSAYEQVAEKHNALGITDPLPTKSKLFFDRPFQVVHLHGDFTGAICARIASPEIKYLAERRLIGSVDQFCDSTDLLCDGERLIQLRSLYTG
ncbi:hypothetical protein LBMAG21_03300 [Armatimonadota bacterium]|nr:hypothetical protein LBMAG21_03300 [Armatimonadota bacterium]